MAKGGTKKFTFYLKEPAQEQIVYWPGDVYFMFKGLRKSDQESVWIIGLDGEHKFIFCDMLFLGGHKSAPIDPCIVFKRILTAGATEFILVHNHPGGNSKPSKDDIKITDRLRQGSNILGI